MAIKQVTTGRGIGWYVDGWLAFRNAIGPWILAAVGYFLLMLALKLIPMLGPIMGIVLGPGLLAGFLVIARAIQGRESVRAGMLLQGLSRPGSRGPLLVLGTVALAGTMLAGLILIYTSNGGPFPGAGTVEASASRSGAPMSAISASAGGMIGAAAVALLVTFSLFFAIPLVTFQNVDPATAMRYSFTASLHNLVPLLLFLFTYIVLAFVAMIPMGLGLLVLLPVGAAAAYQGYREVFPESVEGPAE